ncbi:hypothetical protein LIER_08027 [Lithospermum erythrorhizon]|uniref:Uncharacterized protein n=1 Tax=Lithospermum erythrorhizon TaxID=34254 RepID=A0AAV3PEC3_LITER
MKRLNKKSYTGENFTSGFGHIQVERPNYVKKQFKSYYTTLRNEETDEDEGRDHNETNFVAFTAQIQTGIIVNPPINNRDTDTVSDDEGEWTEEELVTNYQMLFDKWSKLTQAYISKEAEKSKLQRKNLEL